MGNISEPWFVEFYCDHRGRFPVQEFIDQLPDKDGTKAQHFIDLLELEGTNVGRNIARCLEGHESLWELKPKPNRIIYFLHTERTFVLLHGFKKSKQKKTLSHIRKAENRMAIFLEEKNG